MSLARLAAGSRGILRLHGWLLMAWAVTVGLATSAALLHVAGVHSLALRYAVGAGAIYFIGFVAGGWVYARWWNQSREAARAELQHADAADALAYSEQEERIRKRFRWGEWLDFGAGWGGDDPLSALITVVMLLALAAFALLALGYFPLLATEALAGFLAEVVLEFVIGAVIARRVLAPRSLDDYWEVMLRKTGVAGLALVIAAGLVGWLLQTLQPEAVTLFQVFR
ncbi:hypothetical protein [Rhodoferax bucti]|uniref:hypothetical protein n=1 Tax=Rhodoferax bucti TaxID=2576305 RepID=UPI00110896A3|nr:hypothetical protein [Rhodoferax bucti]